MHRVEEGHASQSYGIQVAALAGVPTQVINLAKQKLAMLESMESSDTPSTRNRENQQVELTLETEPDYSELITELNSIEPDNLTPKEALDILYQLKRKL